MYNILELRNQKCIFPRNYKQIEGMTLNLYSLTLLYQIVEDSEGKEIILTTNLYK